jgi:hypothetical protein
MPILKQVIIVIACSFFVNHIAKGQTSRPSRILQNAKGDTMYSDKPNAVAILLNKSIRNKVEITTSQGKLSTNDQQLYSLDSLQNGTVTLSAFRTYNNKKQLLEKRKYVVVTSKERIVYDRFQINPQINLGGYYQGPIQLSVIKKTKSISLNSAFRIVECVVYVVKGGVERPEPLICILNSADFSEDLLSAIKRVGVGDFLSFDSVIIADKDGNRISLPFNINFKFVSDK